MSSMENQQGPPEDRPPATDEPNARPAPPEHPAAPAMSLPPEDVDREVEEALASMPPDELAMLAVPAPERVTPGQCCSGTIVKISGEDVFVDLGGRAEGIVPLQQFDQPPELGSTIELQVERFDSQSGAVILSREGAIKQVAWDQLRVGDAVEGRVTGMVKGGLELDLKGIPAFMPASQCDVQRMRDISVLIGQTLQCTVLEIDRRNRRLLVSRRKFLERQLAEAREALLNELEVGQVRPGTVVNVTDYGAFVELGGGVHGLVHISDLSYMRFHHPSEVVQPGQGVEVKVLKISREKGKISLGLKQVAPDPWNYVGEKYPAGTQVRGCVVRLVDFGAFVELEPGVEALVPISEMTYLRRLRHPSELLAEGQVIEGVVLKVEPKRRRLSISLKRLEEDPWAGVGDKYPAHSVVTGKVTRTTDFGAFVELHAGVEGLVHISELSADRVKRVTDVVQPGQEVRVRVLSVDPKGRKISLSIKGAAEPAQEPPKQEETKPAKKHKRPLRGGLTSDGGWFTG
jgi:small subunit ribosomal protein S1